MHAEVLDEKVTTFLRVYGAGSFSKAAKSLFVSSVWVMKQVNALEASLGVTLFVRTNRGVTPTDAGRILFEDLSRLEREGEEAVSRVRRIEGGQERTVRVGTSVLRPCSPLMNLVSRAAEASAPFRIEVVPFEDDPIELSRTVASLGREIDCFVSPCDSATWRESCSILELGRLRCAVAMPKEHLLASRSELAWDDLEGQELMLMRRGESATLDRLRDDIEGNHPGISVVDVADFYGLGAFNECERRGCLMESFELWSGVHPMLATVPVAWGYELPYGIVYASEPTSHVAEFMGMVASLCDGGERA